MCPPSAAGRTLARQCTPGPPASHMPAPKLQQLAKPLGARLPRLGALCRHGPKGQQERGWGGEEREGGREVDGWMEGGRESESVKRCALPFASPVRTRASAREKHTRR
eukprot:scaffold152710_cov35-Tisochrysis_lutea.AAC.6